MAALEENKSLNLPFVLAITGASGAVYGLRLLQYLLEVEQPVELLISKAALQVFKEENDLVFVEPYDRALIEYLKLPLGAPLRYHPLGDYAASVASGSYRTRGMAIVPCSIGTLG